MRPLAEFQHAARSLARSPLLAAVAVVSLGLGIGANTTIFSFVNAALFRPLPFSEPGRLVDLSEDNRQELCAGCAVGTSWPTFQVWRGQSRSFSDLDAYRESGFALAGAEEPERVGGALVSAGLFRSLGLRPALGRMFSEADEQPGAAPVVLLGYGLWRRRFGGDSSVLGRTVRLNGRPRVVIGVMPEGFRFPEFAALWIPLAPELQGMAIGDRSLSVVGRLKPGVTLAAARADLAGIAARLAAEQPADYRGWTVRVIPERQAFDDASTQGLLLALGAAGFVLLTACANLANLFLARTTARARELAVRVALGASRSRIAGHVLAESVLLGLAGGVLGLLLSFWGVRLVLGLIHTELPFWMVMGTDWRLLAFTVLLSLLVGILFGAVPALRASRTGLLETLKTSGSGLSSGRRDSRIRGALTVAQIALSIVLLAGAGVMVRSFLVVRRTDNLGYRPRGVLSAQLELQAPRYAIPERVRLFQDQLLERLRGQPMLQVAALEHPEFLNSFTGRATRIRLEGQPERVPMGVGPGHGYAVTPDYFRLLEIPLLRGRGILATDGAGSPGVAVVNQQAAAALWPGQNPLGKRLQLDSGPWLSVVGVVGDVVVSPFGRRYAPLLYVAAAQTAVPPVRVLVRYRGDPGVAATTLKAVARTIDADEPVEDVMTLEQSLAQWVMPVRLMALMLGALSAIGLTLAAFGIYAVMSYLVARRTRELGIRMALGAEAGQLRRYVLLRALRLTLIGVVIGLPGAFILTRLLRRLLSLVSPGDPLVFTLTALLLGGLAVLACWGPARRATRVDPLVALRSE